MLKESSGSNGGKKLSRRIERTAIVVLPLCRNQSRWIASTRNLSTCSARVHVNACARGWWEGQAAGAARGREKPDQRGVGWDDFKAEYVGARDATSYVNEIVSIVFSCRGIVPLSVLRGLIEKQRLQFCKIRTSSADVDTRVLHLAGFDRFTPSWKLPTRKFLPQFVVRYSLTVTDITVSIKSL